MDFIRLKKLAFFAYHGVLAAEKENGQRFEVDIEIAGEFSKAGRSDELNDAIDYAQIYQMVTRVMTGNRFNLIEAAGEAIADDLLARFPVQRVKVIIRKPEAPLPGEFECAEVEINRPLAKE